MPASREDVVELLSNLVAIESVTPWLVPGGAGEVNVASYLASALEGLPVEVIFDEIEPGRVNLVAILRGAGDGPTLCLNAHSDTVGYDNWPGEALVPRLTGDRLYGLGAADDKSGCAAGILAMASLARAPERLKGNFMVACVADEEGISIGTEHLVAHHSIDAAVVIEPNGLPRAIVEHQGFGWIDIIVHGRPAHGSAPDKGVDAIVHMAEVVTRLHRHDKVNFVAKPNVRNGRTVFHTGTVQGGTDYATYPSRAQLGIEIGTQPGEHLADRVREIEQIFEEVRREEPGLEAEVQVRLDREPFCAKGHEELYEAFDAAARATMGTDLIPSGLNAWTDAALMQEAGIPTLLMGPLGGNFHAPQEWVSVPEVVALCTLVEDAAVRFLS